jgi:Tol biopolymer transport system component/tRNA A-37 threonylcarbamoyl transferase component Bud32
VTLVPGTRLGPYEITAKLGEGGMGVVFRAKDFHLGREVALKVLPEGLNRDPERLARFEREARLLAQLNHPNIAQIHGLEVQGDTRALVMELVEGPTLAERLEQASLPLDESLSFARQIAEALEEAHDKGIIHRDLKPQNVKVSTRGKVKVLDFGLAKAMDPVGDAGLSPHDLAHSPTVTFGGTREGVILGTAAYMSPEQARGSAVDKRADIWAFGVVLYEMLTGERLFAEGSVVDTLSAVMRKEIDLAKLPPAVPPRLRELVRRCLERDPKRRLRDIGDARLVLEDLVAGRHDEPVPSAIAPSASRTPPARAPWWTALGALVAGLALGVAAARFAREPAEAPRAAVSVSRLEIRPPAGMVPIQGLAVSPDGRRVAFAARREDGLVLLFVRELETLEPRPLAGTEGARYPFWAPDSRRIGYFGPRGLMWTDAAGSAPIEIAPTSTIENVRGGAWSADDRILYSPSFNTPLLAISVRGGESAPATRFPAGGQAATHRFPAFLADGQRFVFYASTGSGTEPGELYLGRLGSLDAKLLGPASSTAVWAGPEHLLYSRGDAIVAHRFDEKSETLVGSPAPIGVSMGSSIGIAGLRSISASTNGVVVFRDDRVGSTNVVWVDRSGRELGSLRDDERTWHFAPRLSPDNRLLAVAQPDLRRGLGEIWIHDLERAVKTRLTLGGGDDYLQVWVRPHGRELVYLSGRPGAPGGLYRIAADRPGEGALWLQGPTYQTPSASSADGRQILFERVDAEGRSSIWIRDLDGDAAERRLSAESASEFMADLSPDGRWIAFTSDASRRREVYVRRVDGVGGAILVSNAGGAQPLWRRDGRELFYVDARERMVAVPIVPGDPLRLGTPVPLFAARLEETDARQYDAFDDGERFALNRAVSTAASPMVVVLDWRALLERNEP